MFNVNRSCDFKLLLTVLLISLPGVIGQANPVAVVGDGTEMDRLPENCIVYTRRANVGSPEFNRILLLGNSDNPNASPAIRIAERAAELGADSVELLMCPVADNPAAAISVLRGVEVKELSAIVSLAIPAELATSGIKAIEIVWSGNSGVRFVSDEGRDVVSLFLVKDFVVVADSIASLDDPVIRGESGRDACEFSYQRNKIEYTKADFAFLVRVDLFKKLCLEKFPSFSELFIREPLLNSLDVVACDASLEGSGYVVGSVVASFLEEKEVQEDPAKIAPENLDGSLGTTIDAATKHIEKLLRESGSKDDCIILKLGSGPDDTSLAENRLAHETIRLVIGYLCTTQGLSREVLASCKNERWRECMVMIEANKSSGKPVSAVVSGGKRSTVDHSLGLADFGMEFPGVSDDSIRKFCRDTLDLVEVPTLSLVGSMKFDFRSGTSLFERGLITFAMDHKSIAIHGLVSARSMETDLKTK